jgi:hypothetical protein
VELGVGSARAYDIAMMTESRQNQSSVTLAGAWRRAVVAQRIRWFEMNPKHSTITQSLADALEATRDCRAALARADLRGATQDTREAGKYARSLADSEAELLARTLMLDAQRLRATFPFRGLRPRSLADG